MKPYLKELNCVFLVRIVEELEEKEQHLQTTFQSKEEEFTILSKEHGTVVNEKHRLLEESKERETELATMNIKITSLEGRLLNKDELINELQNQIQELRSNALQWEQK